MLDCSSLCSFKLTKSFCFWCLIFDVRSWCFLFKILQFGKTQKFCQFWDCLIECSEEDTGITMDNSFKGMLCLFLVWVWCRECHDLSDFQFSWFASCWLFLLVFVCWLLFVKFEWFDYVPQVLVESLARRSMGRSPNRASDRGAFF
jgi:hypothetical protein